jgi:hypothetical protein
MGRLLELALTLTLSRTRERGNNVAFFRKLHFPLSRSRERVGVRATLVQPCGLHA